MTHVVIDGLTTLVGAIGILTGEDATPYAQGARYGRGFALCVVRPASAAQVGEVVKFCAAQGVRVVVQGANTGLKPPACPVHEWRFFAASLEATNHINLNVYYVRRDAVNMGSAHACAAPASIVRPASDELLAPV